MRRLRRGPTSGGSRAIPLVSESAVRRPAGWLPGIEALRAVAAGVVVIHHSWSLGTQKRFPGYWAVQGFGSLGVNLFFLLSGYLLADYFWRAPAERPLGAFYVRRLLRIVPAYYVNVLLLVLFFVPHASVFSARGAKQVMANLTFTQYLWPGMSGSFNANGALWTLTIEMILYLAMPLLALAIGRWTWVAAAALAAIGVGWRVCLGVGGDAQFGVWFKDVPDFDRAIGSLYIGRQFVGFLPIFALGILVKRLAWSGRLDSLRRRLPPLRTPVLVLLLVPSTLWLVYIERASLYNRWIWFSLHDHVMVMLAVPALLYAAQPVIGPLARSMRVLTWLGERSYGLYLWHFPIILSIYGRGTLTSAPSTTYPVLRLVLIIGLSVLFAHVSYIAIERPAQGFGRRVVAWQSRGRVAAEGVLG